MPSCVFGVRLVLAGSDSAYEVMFGYLGEENGEFENSDQRYKVIDHGDLAEFLREDMIDQLRGEERVCRQLIRAFEREVCFLCF